MRSNRQFLVISLAIGFCIGAESQLFSVAADSDEITSDQRDYFENHVRAILTDNCLECHSAEIDPPEGNLRLDSRTAWAKGGDSGPAIVPGNVDDSLLVEAIRYENTDLQMPPDGKLPAADIEVLVKWIAMGAPDPRVADDRRVDKASKSAFDIQQRRNEHWAWQPIQSGDPPSVRDESWPAKTLDRFILAKLEDANLSPAPPAERASLLRRVTFDLIGLPPTPDELAEFLADESNEAFETVVDRLLDSPHFGEHWGQHWLDLVRYAETRGHEQDFAIPAAFRFRDYVIQAFNEDVPFDQLLIEHVAGDLVEPPRLHPIDRTNQSIQGTGFWHLHEQTHSPVDIQGDEAVRMHNQIDVFSRTFLGLSVGCARCHDHKFDAISMRDYYALYGYLQSSSYRETDVADPLKQQEVYDKLVALNEQFAPSLTERLVILRVDQLNQWPSWLSAATELIRDGIPLDAVAGSESADSESAEQDDASKSEWSAGPSEELVRFAESRHLDGAKLHQLAKHLLAARDDPWNPLYVLATSTELAESPSPTAYIGLHRDAHRRVAELRSDAFDQRNYMKVVRSEKDGELSVETFSREWTSSDTVEDFGFQGSIGGEMRWITDGLRFGTGPLAPNAVLLADDPQRPIRWILDTYAAQTVSNRLSGFIRTRTFEVVGDRLWYRYRGKADAFLAVDSHRVVAGPLHGIVKQRLESGSDQWQWHSHNVRDYIGHRVHVEFTPSGDFAIDRVVFAAEQPTLEPPPNPWPIDADASAESVPIDGISRESWPDEWNARFTVELIKRSIDVTNQPQELLSSSDASDRSIGIGVMNWLDRHEDLLPDVDKTHFRNVAVEYVAARKAIEDQLPAPVKALALLDGDAEDEPVHIRGNHRNRSHENVPRGNLTALRSGAGSESAVGSENVVDSVGTFQRGSGRLQLAQELVRRDNPLVTRVYVNRIWHHLFGRGIVETVDDFGVMGKLPTHPELLDHLATKFMQDGWSTKAAIRNIVLSSSYQMSSYPTTETTVTDPTNALIHRMPVRRLPAEAIRDHILAVSGRLDDRMFGESTMVHITPYMRGNRSPEGSGPLDGDGRRSIYTEVRRNHLSVFLTAFDKPVPFMAIGKRSVSNSPAQSLILLNDPFVHEQAELWAKRLLSVAEDDEQRLEQAYLSAFSRPPTADERAALIDFLSDQRRQQAAEPDADLRVWADLCHTLYNVKEFIHIN